MRAGLPPSPNLESHPRSQGNPLRFNQQRTCPRVRSASLNRTRGPLLFGHDLIRKPGPTFRDHALAIAKSIADLVDAAALRRPLRFSRGCRAARHGAEILHAAGAVVEAHTPAAVLARRGELNAPRVELGFALGLR